MMSLVTRCPKCHSDFVVKLKELQAHDGLVRCGSCAHIFDGFETLQSDLPTLTQRAERAAQQYETQKYETQHNETQHYETQRPDAHQPESEPAVLRRRAARPTPFFESPQTPSQEELERAYFDSEPTLRSGLTDGRENSDVSERLSFSARMPEPDSDDQDHSILGESRLRGEGGVAGRTPPEFLVDHVDTQRLKMLLWGLMSALALALLVLQLAYVFRNDLATQAPILRPMLESMCVKLKCEVSLRRYLERISVSVIALERQPSATQDAKSSSMVLKFSMRNRFNQAQPWPDLALELIDVSGTVVLRKVMRPQEYLPREFVGKPFAPAQEVTLNVPMTVTGLQINGYTLKPFFP
jgi:predicted Zn finger-like uncharacterized protein